MVFTLLLLGLLPLVFLADFFPGGDAVADADPEEDGAEDTGTDPGNFLDGFGAEVGGSETGGVVHGATGAAGEAGSGDGGEALEPDTGDEVPAEGDEVDPATVLDPNADDEEPAEGEEVDPVSVLDPNEDPEEAFPIGGDGAGEQTFWVYADGRSGVDVAEVSDFHVGEDVLRLTLTPGLGLDEPEVMVGPSDDGQDGVVTVNGMIVAVLRGAPGATADDVLAEVAAGALI